ncbi:MAG: Na+/H+ antiporter NhaA [Sandaracinus sp.]
MPSRPRRWLRSLRRFLEIEASSGILLAAATAIALVWASSPWGASHHTVWEWSFGTIAGHAVTPHAIVDDVLMTIFFFVVGLEIRRELSVGALRDRRRAALPAFAALGGMVVPAGVYLLVAGAAETRAGWGIPTATDIAFALGALTLLGSRVPPALRVLLLALAVIDDLGAIVVIAVFYSRGIAWAPLVGAGLAIVAVLWMQRRGVRSKPAYVVPGVAMWVAFLAAGLHPTLAGVALGLLTPPTGAHDDETSPSEELVTQLHPWVAFGVMPLFALANAGVDVRASAMDASATAVALGVTAGLVIGKPLGIVSASAIAVRLRIAELPGDLTLRHLIVLGMIGGVGFTMSLFVSALAFAGDPALLDAARIAVLAASALATLVAVTLGYALLRTRPSDRA